MARSLRSHRTSVIDHRPRPRAVLRRVAQGSQGDSPTGYELIVCAGDGHVGAQVGWERRYLSRLNGTLADGTLLVTPTVVDVTHTAPCRRHRSPRRRYSPLPTVASQNLEGAMTATHYLIGLGPSTDRVHRRSLRPGVGPSPRTGVPQGAGAGRDRVRSRTGPCRRVHPRGDGGLPVSCSR